MKSPNPLFASLPTTVFTRMSALAVRHGAINLGQGFPDRDGPDWIIEAAARALRQESNQYPPATGVPTLRQAIADHEARFYGLSVDPDQEVIVTSGATEALADCFLALLEPGDEAVVIEPFYDSYVPQIRAAGGVPRFVRLTPPDWSVSEAGLRTVLSDKTKLLVLNSPMNPSSKLFTDEELTLIARLAEEFDFYVVCDEVYEHLTFDGLVHKPLIAREGMRERCVRIASAGKIFSFTGWKVGYMIADAPLASVLMKAHQFVTFTTPPALQYAVAAALAAPDDYFQGLIDEQQALRDFLSTGLKSLGFAVAPAAGTYFITTDISAISDLDDEVFCEFITREAKVAAIPMSAFYSPEGAGDVPRQFVRFCFSKQKSVLDEALKRLDRGLAAQ
ncbi:MAG: aminotransferase [Alphaproteobacteria bacterium]|nr:MAG: aminotransferase [Alphaproteobacteria bacterium]